ncbi:DUF3592 domain-containing protein [Actinopolymorpha sp. B17G11]|uniref:DUF3592 domain-containing protein n=1 Tax=unclassified Actinopolymorpha TaxID=2627063 RepID=UPI0032D99078
MKPWYAASLVLLVLGVLFAGVSFVRLRTLERLRRQGVTATGVVVGQDASFQSSSADSSGGLVHAPVVRFTTRTGQVVQVRPPAQATHTSYIPGRPVVVHYDPAAPERAVVAGFERGIYRIFLAIGVTALVVAAALAVLPASGRAAVVGLLPVLAPLGVGLVFGGIGWGRVRRVVRIQRSGVEASGVVVGETTSRTRDGIAVHHPVVRYVLPDGQWVDVPSFRGTVSRRAQQGQQVVVRYDPADPGKMLLRGDGPEPVFVIFAIVGAVALAASVAIAFVLTGLGGST